MTAKRRGALTAQHYFFVPISIYPSLSLTLSSLHNSLAWPGSRSSSNKVVWTKEILRLASLMNTCTGLDSVLLPSSLCLYCPSPTTLLSPTLFIYFHIFSDMITCKFQSPCCLHCPLAAPETSENRPSEHCLYPALIKQAVCGWLVISGTCIVHQPVA